MPVTELTAQQPSYFESESAHTLILSSMHVLEDQVKAASEKKWVYIVCGGRAGDFRPKSAGAGSAQTVIMVGLSDVNRPFSGCLYTTRVHIGIKGLIREHEGTLTQTELAIMMQIPLLGVSVLPKWRCR